VGILCGTVVVFFTGVGILCNSFKPLKTVVLFFTGAGTVVLFFTGAGTVVLFFTGAGTCLKIKGWLKLVDIEKRNII